MLPCYDSMRILVYSQAKCIKTGPGTHTCQCLSGWREDGDECQTINKCLDPSRGGCHPNATCIYVGPGQVRGVLWFPNPIYLDLYDFWWFIFYPRVTVHAKVATTAMGGIVNLSISVWSRRVDVISWWGLKQIIIELHIFFFFFIQCRYAEFFHFHGFSQATCQFLNPGGWQCVCEDGYAGDGKICYGTLAQVLCMNVNFVLFDKEVRLLLCLILHAILQLLLFV